VVATVLTAPLVAYGLVLLVMAGWLVSTMWTRSPVAAVVIVSVVVAVMATVVTLSREARRTAGGVLGAHSAQVRPVPDDHPAIARLARLCALADVAVPELERVSAPGSNACVVVDGDRRAIRLTDDALTGLTAAQLDAVLAHELFHLENGDARSAARWEAAADLAQELADGSLGSVGRFVRAGVRELLRSRELAADRAAVLLTGEARAMAEAIEICSASRGDIPNQDLRAVGAAAFVAEEASADGRFATHPTTAERLDVVARAGAQLGRR
jgi:heat shock protein HtpX